MDQEQLAKKLKDHFSRNELALLGTTVRDVLNRLREDAIQALEGIVQQVEGRLRMALLEVLSKDGGADLIPLFINCIREEKNTLYAKSQILLFKEFRHQRALGALLSIEEDIDAELKSTYQRTLGRLLSQFSEQFYMSEFQAGIGDPKRVKFAADMMMRSPHSDFLPFLRERVQENDLGYRHEGLRVLGSQGSKECNDALFGLLSRLRRQLKRCHSFDEVLASPRNNLKSFFKRLVERASLDWDVATRNAHFAAIDVGDIEDPLDQILDGYLFTSDVRRKVKPYLKGLLCGAEMPSFQVSRFQTTMEEYTAELTALLHQNLTTMGSIAERAKDKDFHQRLENQLPPDEPDRDALIIASLGGNRGEDSLDLLKEYVNTCTEPEILTHALAALDHYEVEDIPRGVEKLCFEQDGVLRKKAVNLVARWGNGQELAQSLMASDQLAICADGVRLVADFKLENNYFQLADMLKKSIPDSLIINVLEALRAFPRPHTGRVVKALLLPPRVFSVRNAALLTCFYAGGEDRMEYIMRTLALAQPGKVDDCLDVLLTLLLTEEFEERDLFLLREREFWLSLFKPVHATLLPKLLQMIEHLPIADNYQARAWLAGLKKVAVEFSGSLGSGEQQRVQAIIGRLGGAVQNFVEQERSSKLLEAMLSALKTTNAYQRTQAMRQLANNYPQEIVENNDVAMEQIMEVVTKQLTLKEPVKDALMQAIALAGKLRHPNMQQLVRPFLTYSNIDVRNVAKLALELGLDERYTKPVKHIFIMDDSRYITKQLVKFLTRASYEVDFENDVDKGLQRLAEHHFDLLILDILMPRKLGPEFLREARLGGFAPEFTLVMTSSRAREDLKDLMATGVQGLLLKPFRMDELLMQIKGLVPIPSRK